ncbi:MAG: hypothetical protein M5U01_30560 [Ardenticatenaceae bacterium]|nr:hypothetical protein [Ardenticatenaceae bacterium]
MGFKAWHWVLVLGVSALVVACGGAPAAPVTPTQPFPAVAAAAEPTATVTPPTPSAATRDTHLVFLVLGSQRPEVRWVPVDELGLPPVAAGNSTQQPSGLPVAGEVQVVGDRAYMAQEGTVFAYTPDGQMTPLEFTSSAVRPAPIKPFLVSPSGRQIVWVEPQFQEAPGTRRNVLSVANIDGSNARVVWELEEDQPGYLQPLGWNEPAGLLSVGLMPVMADRYVAPGQPGALELTQVDLSGEGSRPRELISQIFDCGERACILGVSPNGTQFASVEYGQNDAPTRLVVGSTTPGGALVWDLPAGVQSLSDATWLEQPGQLAVKALGQDGRFQIIVADLQANSTTTWYEGAREVTPRLFVDARRLLVVSQREGEGVGGVLATLLLTPDGTLDPVAPEMAVLGSGVVQ